MKICIRHATWALTFVLIASIAGCGSGRPKVVPVSGQVLMNGKPLTGSSGFVRVQPADGRAATGDINKEDGTFTLTTFEPGDGCMPGTHPAAVIVNVSVGPKVISLIPEKYSDAKTSGLQVAIDKKTDSLKIELTGELKAAPKPTAADLKGDF